MATLEELMAVQAELDGAPQVKTATLGELESIQAELDKPRLKGSLTPEQFQSEFGDIPDILGLVKPQEEAPSRPISETLTGAGEAALTVGTAATSGTIGAVAGTLQGLISEIESGQFGTDDAARRIADKASSLMQELTYTPRSEAGREIVGDIGAVGEALAPLAGLGGQVAQIGQAAKLAAPHLSAQSQAIAGAPAVRDASQVVKGLFTRQSKAKQRIAQLIEEGSADVSTAKFDIDTPRASAASGASQTSNNPFAKLKLALDVEGPKIKADPIASEAIKQGFDDGVIAAIKASSRTDQDKMLKMVKIMEEGKKNRRFAAENRPSDIVGDSLMERFRTIKKINSEAGRNIRKEATALKGKPIDLADAANGFADSLDDLGVKLTIDSAGDFKPNFDLSQLGPGDRGPLKEVIRQMNIRSKDGSIDGLTAHKMKKIIDNNVTFGKVKTGISGDAERALKAFRSDINKSLGETFPEYGKHNKIYSDTIGVLDEFQDIAGRKMNLLGENVDKSVGTVMRGLLSNNKGRVRLLDSVGDIEAVAKKYGGGGKKLISGSGAGTDDLLNQILFVDELDARFGPVARTSLAGEVGKEIQRGAQVAKGGIFEASVDLAAKGIDKARGINDEAAFKSIRELLMKGKK